MAAESNRSSGWLIAGIRRQKRGVIAALMLVWLGMPAALLLAALGLIFGTIAGGLGAGESGLAATFHINEAAGFGGAFLGAFVGLAFGFAIFIWFLFHSVPGAVGDIVSGILVAYVTLLVLIGAERPLLHLRGYRELSRREREYIEPILDEVLERMHIQDARPALYMNDAVTPGAWTYPQSIVFAEGLFGAYDATEAPPRPDLSRAAIAAIVAHEVVHWRDGDAVATRAVWSCFWPFIAAFNLMRMIGKARGWLVYLLWMIFWPIWICLKLIAAIMSSATRQQEYEADAGAAALGDEYRLGLREALTELRDMEPPRTGWEDVLTATHPKIEERLERLEANYQPAIAKPLTLTIAGERRTVTISSVATLDALRADDDVEADYDSVRDNGDEQAIARERQRVIQSKLHLLQAIDADIAASGGREAKEEHAWVRRGIEQLQQALDGASPAAAPLPKPPPAVVAPKEKRPQATKPAKPPRPAKPPAKRRKRPAPTSPQSDSDADDRWGPGFLPGRAPIRPIPPAARPRPRADQDP